MTVKVSVIIRPFLETVEFADCSLQVGEGGELYVLDEEQGVVRQFGPDQWQAAAVAKEEDET